MMRRGAGPKRSGLDGEFYFICFFGLDDIYDWARGAKWGDSLEGGQSEGLWSRWAAMVSWDFLDTGVSTGGMGVGVHYRKGLSLLVFSG